MKSWELNDNENDILYFKPKVHATKSYLQHLHMEKITAIENYHRQIEALKDNLMFKKKQVSHISKALEDIKYRDSIILKHSQNKLHYV